MAQHLFPPHSSQAMFQDRETGFPGCCSAWRSDSFPMFFPMLIRTPTLDSVEQKNEGG